MVSAYARKKARWTLNHAVQAGKIQKLPCEKCGNPDSRAHHHDYDKPLDVVWLCVEHHGLDHSIYPRQKECVVCGKVFTPAPTKRKRAQTCSWECRSELMRQRMQVRKSPTWRARQRRIALKNGLDVRGKALVLYRWRTTDVARKAEASAWKTARRQGRKRRSG